MWKILCNLLKIVFFSVFCCWWILTICRLLYVPQFGCCSIRRKSYGVEWLQSQILQYRDIVRLKTHLCHSLLLFDGIDFRAEQMGKNVSNGVTRWAMRLPSRKSGFPIDRSPQTQQISSVLTMCLTAPYAAGLASKSCSGSQLQMHNYVRLRIQSHLMGNSVRQHRQQFSPQSWHSQFGTASPICLCGNWASTNVDIGSAFAVFNTLSLDFIHAKL